MTGSGDLEPRRRLVEELNDIVAVVAVDATVTYVNAAVQQVLGYAPTELIGDAGTAYVHPDDRDTVTDAIEAVGTDREASRTVDCRLRRADGSWCWIEAILQNRTDDDVVDSILVTGRDITDRREREAELVTTKRRMQLALEGANLGIWDWDMQTGEVSRDELLTEMLGYTQAEMGDRMRGWERVVHPEDRERHDEALAEHISKRTPYYWCDHRLKTKSGSWKWVRTIGTVVERDADGDPTRAVGIHQDIDDRKRAELALEEERDMFKEGPAVVFRWEDAAGWPIEYVSKNVEEVLGYAPDELQSGEFRYIDIVHEEDRERVVREASDLESGAVDSITLTPYRVITASGDVRWVKEYTRTVESGGETPHLVGYLVDVTERKRRERELRQFKSAVERSAHAIYITDAEGRIEYVNPAFEEITGYSEQAAVGETPRILKSGEYDDDFYEEFWETITSGEQWEAEMIDERSDDERIVLNQTVAPITDDDGDVRKFVAVARDITERKDRERKLREREQKYRSLFEGTRDALMVFDRDGYLDCNERALELFGIGSVEEFREYTPWELSPPRQPNGEDSKVAALAHIETAFEEGEAFFEWTHQHSDGEEFPSEVKLSRFEYQGTPAIHALVRDISARKKRERELKESEEKYRSLFENTRDALMLLDRDGFIDCNERTLELFGVDSVDAFVGRAPWELSPPQQPDGTDSKAAALAHVETAFEEGEAFFEWTHQRVDGTTFPAEVKLSRFEYEGEPVLHALVRDVTARKEYERRLEEQRDNLDVLNRVLRHDIRNDLQVITGYVEILADECDDEEADAHFETIDETLDHAIGLTKVAREMADVMLSTDEASRPVDFRTVLENELGEIRSTYSEAVVSTETAVPRVTVEADDMLHSVFRNLLKNAIQHNDAETPRVTVSVTERDDTAVLRIADNGPGVPENQRENIFGKGEKGLDSQGTGIGLYLVDTLVENYGGEVGVEDSAAGGAAFVVELPTAE
ncbi:PAS domain S-box protein [Haloplanus salilacus]|uniref:PAS domain S-box protein n=1 Tax=Haloplanus salilacus TaxID=2949994 RepID=UPI0030D3F538